MLTDAPQHTHPPSPAPRPKPSRLPHALASYGIAVLAPALALALTLAVGGRIERAPLIFLFPAVVVAGWYGGRGPGLTATVLSLVAAEFFLFPPTGSFRVAGDELLALAAFGMVAALTSLLIGWLHEARRQAEERRVAAADLTDLLAREVAESNQRALLVQQLEGEGGKRELQARELMNRETRLERTLHHLEQTTAALRRSNGALAARSREAEGARAEAGRAVARLDEIALITQAVLRQDTLDAVLHEILDQAQRVLGTTEATILLLDGDGQRLRPRATRGLNEDLIRSVEIPVGMGMAGRVAHERRPLVAADVTDIDIVNPHLRESVHSLMAVPLLIDGTPIGVLHVGSAMRREFSVDDRTFLELVAERVASVIERTRLYEAEREARRAAEAATREAEAANRARGDFVTALSHDLRTPLNAIVGYAQILELGLHGLVTERQSEDLGRIRSSAQHQLALLDRLLSYARLEAGRIQYDLRDVPVDEVLRGLESMIAPQVRERQ